MFPRPPKTSHIARLKIPCWNFFMERLLAGFCKLLGCWLFRMGEWFGILISGIQSPKPCNIQCSFVLPRSASSLAPQSSNRTVTGRKFLAKKLLRILIFASAYIMLPDDFHMLSVCKYRDVQHKCSQVLTIPTTKQFHAKTNIKYTIAWHAASLVMLSSATWTSYRCHHLHVFQSWTAVYSWCISARGVGPAQFPCCNSPG